MTFCVRLSDQESYSSPKVPEENKNTLTEEQEIATHSVTVLILSLYLKQIFRALILFEVLLWIFIGKGNLVNVYPNRN